MDRLTIIDMLSKFFKYLGKNPLFILVFIILILVYFYLVLSPIYTKKHKIIYTIFFTIATVALIIVYGSAFWSFIDYLIDNIFVAIYFPNLPIYMIMVIITIIIFISTMFRSNISKGIKRLNTLVFLIIMFLLLLSLNIVIDKNINVYSDIAVYSNEYLLVMIQMTMNIFTIWILVLLILKLINKLRKKAELKDQEDQEIQPEKIQTIIYDEPKFIPRKKKEELFTLEEYKLLYQYLNEIKEKNKNQDD